MSASLPKAESIGDVGDPAYAILRAADEHDVDLIVVGSHTHSWFSRLFTGSVSNDLLREADIPVLVVK
jgi:nucleotide-binding universal stress UspA family protein